MGFQDLVEEMVNHDLQIAQQEAMLQKATGKSLHDKSVK
jgi:hypothetical protein